MTEKTIYLDNAATTKMSKSAINAMLPYMDSIYGNPSSLHSVGQKANEALVNARERIAKLLGCEAREITFTSGGSEADNQAIVSAARFGKSKGKNALKDYYDKNGIEYDHSLFPNCESCGRCCEIS